MTGEPRTWDLFAVRRADAAGAVHYGGPFVESDSEKVLRVAYGNTANVVPVRLTESASGRYYGWVERDGRVVMVQPHRSAFEIQFPYGSAAEVERERGEVVRLAVSER